jgi:hypothetical protein
MPVVRGWSVVAEFRVEGFTPFFQLLRKAIYRHGQNAAFSLKNFYKKELLFYSFGKTFETFKR